MKTHEFLIIPRAFLSEETELECIQAPMTHLSATENIGNTPGKTILVFSLRNCTENKSKNTKGNKN